MSEQATVSQKEILVVDDDDGARESIKLLLGIDGHRVTEARDGQEALGRFSRGRFDLVITDYLMPNMLGDELVHSIRYIAPEQPILMVTAYFENLDRDMPADAVLSKPFGVDELRLAIAKPIARSAAHAPNSSCGTDDQDFSRHTMAHRASANTEILNKILERPLKTPEL